MVEKRRSQKKKSTAAPVQNPDDVVDDMVAAYRGLCARGGEPLMESLDDSYNIYGYELKGMLPLQYVLGINVLAFGRTILLAGPPQGGKSQMAYYLANLFAGGGGLVNVYETEGKVSKEQIYGLWNSKELVERRLNFKYCRTQQKAQKAMTKNTGAYEDMCISRKSWPPLCSILDSMSGNASDDQAKAIEEDGAAGMSTAGLHKAKSWKEWFQVYIPNHVAMMPYTMFVVNHEGTEVNLGGGGPASFGGPKKTTGAGGVHKDFMSTWTLSLTSDASVTEKVGVGTDYGRHSITKYRIKNIKNSLGIKSRKAEYTVIAYRDAEGQRVLQLDWDSALVDLLSDDANLKLEAGSINNYLDLKGSGQKWTCPMVGVPHKGDPVSKQAMGALLHSTPEVYAMIQKELLDVSVHPDWSGQEAKDIAMREIKAKMKDRGISTKAPQKRRSS